ncbi:hypothetical protein E2C01_033777 [Portunus trituberculatus]|uniref:Uncharacterized protein n=1 Tax=Portunus trituberculatus TaxID=210409 RepID=A0A5B7EZQ8_PORTR|nr:hypothetical protein [Portunus trituberculatus]
MVAMAELSTQMSLSTCLPSCAPPTNTYSEFPLAQLVVLRGDGTVYSEPLRFRDAELKLSAFSSSWTPTDRRLSTP